MLSDTSRSVKNKFHLKHSWGLGKAEFGFLQDPIRTLVSMATYSSHMVSIMGELLVTTLAPLFLISSSQFLRITSKTINTKMGLTFSKIRSGTVKLDALEHLEKNPHRLITVEML